jgi:hypothetical protein
VARADCLLPSAVPKSTICRDDTLTYVEIFHLDILLEALYPHLECLLKNNANASNCCRGRWTC